MSLQPQAQAVKGWPGPLSARNRPNSFAEWVLGCNLPAPFNLSGQGAPPEFALATAHIRPVEVLSENPAADPAEAPPPPNPNTVPRPAAAAKSHSDMALQPAPVAMNGRTTPAGKDLRLQLEVYSDNLDKTDTMTITLPRPGSMPQSGCVLPGAAIKKVAFIDGVKSALKAPHGTVIELSAASSESDLDLDASSSSSSSSSSDDDSAGSDEEGDHDGARKPRHHRKPRHRTKHKHACRSRCTRRRRASSRSPCDYDCGSFLRDALKSHGRMCDSVAKCSHCSKDDGNDDGFFVSQKKDSDAVWSDDDISDPFYRFTDSETLPNKRNDRTKVQPTAKVSRPKVTQPAQAATKSLPTGEQAQRTQTCLPVAVPVYYPVGIEPGKRPAYGPSMPWKLKPAPDQTDRGPVCLQCRAMQLQGAPHRMASPVYSDNRPRFHHQQDTASDSSGRASNDSDKYYYWTQQAERKRHARSRSVTCNRDLEYPPGWTPSPNEWHTGGASYGYYHHVPESPIVYRRELEYAPGWQPDSREWNYGGHSYCYHHRAHESPPMHHREIDYRHNPPRCNPPPPEYNTVRCGYQHHPHVTISPARSLGRLSNSTESYFGNSRYPVPGAWYDPPEAEHKLRDDYKRHRMEVYKREQERLERERARLDRRQSQEQDRRQAKKRARERESSPPPVWGDASAAQSRHKTADAGGQATDVVW